jgi:hypothetical protein
MTKKAWQLEREYRDAAVPVDRRKEAAHWEHVGDFPHGDGLLRWNWNVRVPGSLAPDSFFLSMVQGTMSAKRNHSFPKGKNLKPRGAWKNCVYFQRVS